MDISWEINVSGLWYQKLANNFGFVCKLFKKWTNICRRMQMIWPECINSPLLYPFMIFQTACIKLIALLALSLSSSMFWVEIGNSLKISNQYNSKCDIYKNRKHQMFCQILWNIQNNSHKKKKFQGDDEFSQSSLAFKYFF